MSREFAVRQWSHPILGSVRVPWVAGLLAGLPAATVLLLQERPTPEVFRLFGLRRSPLVTLLVGTFVAVGALSGLRFSPSSWRAPDPLS